MHGTESEHNLTSQQPMGTQPAPKGRSFDPGARALRLPTAQGTGAGQAVLRIVAQPNTPVIKQGVWTMGPATFCYFFLAEKVGPPRQRQRWEKKLVPLPRRTPELPQKIIHYKYQPAGYSPVTKVFHYIIYTPMAAGRQKLTRRGQLRVRLFVCIKSGPSILDGPPHLISAAATHTPPRHGYPLQPPGCCP